MLPRWRILRELWRINRTLTDHNHDLQTYACQAAAAASSVLHIGSCGRLDAAQAGRVGYSTQVPHNHKHVSVQTRPAWQLQQLRYTSATTTAHDNVQHRLDRQQRLDRLQSLLQCDAAAVEALCRQHPQLLLLGPYALRRLASTSHETFTGTGSHGAKAAATSRLLLEVVVDAPCTLQMRAMHWGMRLHIGQLVSHCQDLGLAVDSGKDFAVVWLGPHLQPRVVRHQHRHQHARGGGGGGGGGAGSGGQQQQPPTQQRHEEDLRRQRHEAMRLRRHRDEDAPLLLVAYRHGAVMLLGPPVFDSDEDFEMPDQDAAALSRVMPLGAFYRSGRSEGSQHAGPSLAQPAAADFHTIQIDPDADHPASKEPNKLVLKTLDIGHLRVASSILGQSVALSQVDGEVDAALTALHAAMARAPVTRGTSIFASAQDSRLFKAAAYGSMAITEAHSLLDAGELSWRYDAFSEAWDLMQEDYCLQIRFQALQMKLDEFKQTATFDLKNRHGRRYAKLTDRVILLLVISCAIALLELLLPHDPEKGSRHGGQNGGSEEWQWDEGAEPKRRWWQFRVPLQQVQQQPPDGSQEPIAAVVAGEEGMTGAAPEAAEQLQRDEELLLEGSE